MSEQCVIVIPARYGSTRFPGKPLAMIGEKSMLAHVYDIACAAKKQQDNIEVIIATDDDRIKAHALALNAKVVLTPVDCRTGSDRVLSACAALSYQPDIVINLQGDAPLTPADFVSAIIDALQNDPSLDVATPVTQLSWLELDKLREQKIKAPFSGTTAIVDKNQHARWFSKQILPAIRNEEKLRQSQPLSPVLRHIGLYGYRYQSLKKMAELPSTDYENHEGLEQLRMLENDFVIKACKVSYRNRPQMSGVDTQADLDKARALFQTLGESAHA